MKAHVDLVKTRVRASLWALRHLRHNGFSNDNLLAAYRAVILPVHH